MKTIFERTDRAAMRARVGFERWLADAPAIYREHIQALIEAEAAGRESVRKAERRAAMAEKCERDGSRGVAMLKRRIAELESRG